MSKQKTYYQLQHIRRPLRDWGYLKKIDYCPLCKRIVRLYWVGMMNHNKGFGKVVSYDRCPICLVKIPLPKTIISLLANPFPKHRQKHPPKTIDCYQRTLV